MAPLGPLARLVAQVIVPVVAVLARAIPAAYAQALQNARKSGMDANTAAKASTFLRKTMTKAEALQILNLSESEATAEAILKVSRFS
jgi:import inner membrane translocase subunit TIM16